MPSDYAFRLSTYITLALSCICLGVAEWDWLPEVTVFTALVVALLAVSFILDKRAELSLNKANLLGLGIALVAVMWLVFQMSGPSTGVIAQLGWPTNLLPYLGPVLMVLIPAKLFRPKHIGDWWTMHAVGMAAVGLAASMDDQPMFAILLALYTGSAVISLLFFFYRRSAHLLQPVPNRPVSTTPIVITEQLQPRDLRRSIGRGLGWLVLASIFALPAFFLTPRTNGEQWGFTRGRMETGYTPDQTVDMNRTGELEPNSEVAFEVIATNPDGRAKEDLPEDQHWRGTSYQVYTGGKWSSQSIGIRSTGWNGDQDGAEPNLGPSTFHLDFYPTQDSKVRPLASPIFWQLDAPNPVISYVDSAKKTWKHNSDGSFQPPALDVQANKAVMYRQTTRTATEAGLAEGFEKSMSRPTNESNLRENRLASIRDWSRKLLERLVSENKLPKEVAEEAESRPVYQVDSQHHEMVARAFCDYFANSGDYQYTLRLRRQDRKLDPLEDFLLNTKEGHCERFAAALALTLRSLNIPTQLVLGYRGQEHIGGGRYLVRQEKAHAWVEVLISRPSADGDLEAKKKWHWLTLDPTPASNENAEQNRKSWFTSAREFGVTIFEDFIVGYNPERRQKAVEATTRIVDRWWPVGLAILAASIGIRQLRRRNRRQRMLSAPQAPPQPVPAWYQRLLDILARHGLPLPAGVTPKEHADRVAVLLRASDRKKVADLPLFVVSKLYRVRFAIHPLTANEESDMTAALDRLEAALHGWMASEVAT